MAIERLTTVLKWLVIVGVLAVAVWAIYREFVPAPSAETYKAAAAEVSSGENTMTIEGTANGEPFACVVKLTDPAPRLTYKALAIIHERTPGAFDEVGKAICAYEAQRAAAAAAK